MKLHEAMQAAALKPNRFHDFNDVAMRNTFDPYTWHNNLHLRWTVLPVLAYVFSWMTGWAGIVFFPVLITVAQYLIFKIHPAVAQPGFWFLTLPITFYVWVKWGPVITYSQPNGILSGVVAYYAGQILNSLFIPLIIKPGKPEFLLNWLLSNLVTGLIWMGLYKLFIAGWSTTEIPTAGNLAMLIIYPTIALVANGVSGFVFKNSLIITDERS